MVYLQTVSFMVGSDCMNCELGSFAPTIWHVNFGLQPELLPSYAGRAHTHVYIYICVCGGMHMCATNLQVHFCGYVFFRGFFFRNLFAGHAGNRQASKPASKRASKPASKQASERASKPASKQASQPASKQASEQASKPASQQASKAARQQASKQASKPASQQASKQARQQASKPASKQASEQASKGGSTAVSEPRRWASHAGSQQDSQPGSKQGRYPIKHCISMARDCNTTPRIHVHKKRTCKYLTKLHFQDVIVPKKIKNMAPHMEGIPMEFRHLSLGQGLSSTSGSDLLQPSRV